MSILELKVSLFICVALQSTAASYQNIEKPRRLARFFILVDLVSQNWNLLHEWVFEASSVILELH